MANQSKKSGVWYISIGSHPTFTVEKEKKWVLGSERIGVLIYVVYNKKLQNVSVDRMRKSK